MIEHAPAGTDAALAEADGLVAAGRLLDAVDLLHRANASLRDDRLEVRLARLRYEAFAEVRPASRFDSWPVPVPGADPAATPPVPDLAPADLGADAVRAAIAARGSVRLPGLLAPAQVDELVAGIDAALAAREQVRGHPFRTVGSTFAGLPLPKEQAISLGRDWIAGAGGILACDAPKVLDRLLAVYEEVGLRRVVADYLGERPILSANKTTLRRVPTTANTDWHQDGAFLGSTQGIRALNVWVALTDCGVDAPGMDLLPRRFEAVQETGTGGAIFDWAVGPDTVAALAADAPVVRPRFQAGDALLFDDLFLHRTAVEPSMTQTRYAIESWFFAPTSYPSGQVPLVW